MIITARPDRQSATTGRLSVNGLSVPCAFGRSGLTREKKEGDGCTPIGDWPLRKLYYRADRLTPPATGLTATAISKADGWCDDPEHPLYNQLVELPFEASHEVLQRDDHLYDLMIPMGYNDVDIVAGRGSAIFFHLAKPDYQPTEGCVAIARADMEVFLPLLSPQTILRVSN